MLHHHPHSLAVAVRERRAPAAADAVIREALAGDHAALTAVVERFTGLLRSVARSYRLGHHDTEDLVQATWLRLLERADGVREPDALPGWLHTTARHEALHRLRAVTWERPADEALAGDAPAPDADPVADVLARERADAVARALDALPERQRRLVRLLFDDSEPSYTEIAGELDLPIGSIGPTRSRCLARLQRDESLSAVAAA